MKWGISVLACVWACLVAVPGGVRAVGPQQPVPASAAEKSSERVLLDRYCVTCHNQRLNTAGLALETFDVSRVGDHAEVWEKVVRKMRGGLMPPAGRPRPDPIAYEGFVTWLETRLDAAAAASPNPGRTETFHRLNRAEYRNAVRDVLALQVDVAALVPADSASHGFDNVAGGLRISESLMERYLTAARRISRAAVGVAPATPAAETYNVSPALPQDDRVEGLPFGTRGGMLVTHQFPYDAEYVFRFELANATNGAELEFLLDGERIKLFEVERGQRAVDLDGNEQNEKLEVRIPVKAGPREVAAAFSKTPSVLLEAARRPFLNPTVSRPPLASLRSVTITGPFDGSGVSDTPSRQRIFTCRPAAASGDDGCAKTILSDLARRAFRRPVTGDDMKTLLAAYHDARADGASSGGAAGRNEFEAGIERGIRQILVSPEFLFRVEADPARVSSPSYRLGGTELASRLSFFLWSSVPDDQLLDAAIGGRLNDRIVLGRQVRRMLGDARSAALTSNFAGQWLQLRNLDSATPSEVLFPDFDDGLREGFRRETELLFESVLREDRSVVDLLTADYTYVNDRVAAHYGIPNVQGSHFRRVTLADPNRRGLLGQGSILTITSHPVRTSPVFRGKWILENILGTPPPPPPPNVPALPEKTGVYAGKAPSMRERMAAHRDNAACASCHSMIDPLGFGLEQYDAVGRWREVDEMYSPIDASGVLPDGAGFSGVAELRAALAKRPERFVTTLTEKLLTYALGRGLEHYDMPTVRGIVREAAKSNFRMSAIITGITNSLPFRMRRTAEGMKTND
jgi:hypothetical protein